MPIIVRQATRDDLTIYEKLQTTRWSDDNQVSREQLESRFFHHPEGMLVAEEDGAIVGMVFAMRITQYDEQAMPSWYDITHNGLCDNHDPKGPIIFGVDLTTKRGVGARAGDELLIGVAKLAIAHNIRECMLGGRMPGYHKYKDTMSAEKYLWSKDKDGKFLDKQVRFYASLPGLRVVKPLKDYFDDPESDNYGVLLRWRNPFYRIPPAAVWSRLFPLLFRLEEAYISLRRRLRS